MCSGHPIVDQLQIEVDLGDRRREAGQAAGQAEVVEHRRAQPADRRTGLGQGEIDQVAGLLELLGRRGLIGVVDRAGGRVEAVGQPDQPLGDAVVDVPGQAAPLTLLRGDHLLGEVLVGAFPRRQLAVQPGLVQRTRDQPADHQQQFDVARREVAPLDGVHVEHPDQATRLGLHRHRRHRREVLCPATPQWAHTAGRPPLSLTITTGSRWLATQPDTPEPSGIRTSPTCSSKGGVAPARVSERSVSSSTWTKQTSDAVAAVIIRATAAAIGSTPGPLEVAAMMSSNSATSGRRRPGRARPAR